MRTYRLTYFDFRGKAELSRLVFASAGVEFEDKRVQKEEWPDIKKNLEQKLLDEVFPRFIGFFEKLPKDNGGQYFVGSLLTLADLAVIAVFDTPLQKYPSLLDKSSALQAHRKLVESLPTIADYLKNRKHTEI